MTRLRLFLPCMAMLLLALPGPAPGLAQSPVVAEADGIAIRAVIRAQLDAFLADDAAAAFAYNAPGLRQQFRTPEQFMAIVRHGYMPVYRWRSADFGIVTRSGDGATQEVFVVGDDGESWVAMYQLQRQRDGSWLISGCVLEPDDAQAI
jgi:hypothetical protein